MYADSVLQLGVVFSKTLQKIKLFLWYSLSSNSLTMFTVIEQEESV